MGLVLLGGIVAALVIFGIMAYHKYNNRVPTKTVETPVLGGYKDDKKKKKVAKTSGRPKELLHDVNLNQQEV